MGSSITFVARATKALQVNAGRLINEHVHWSFINKTINIETMNSVHFSDFEKVQLLSLIFVLSCDIMAIISWCGLFNMYNAFILQFYRLFEKVVSRKNQIRCRTNDEISLLVCSSSITCYVLVIHWVYSKVQQSLSIQKFCIMPLSIREVTLMEIPYKKHYLIGINVVLLVIKFETTELDASL